MKSVGEEDAEVEVVVVYLSVQQVSWQCGTDSDYTVNLKVLCAFDLLHDFFVAQSFVCFPSNT